jgi:hypothetical protein
MMLGAILQASRRRNTQASIDSVSMAVSASGHRSKLKPDEQRRQGLAGHDLGRAKGRDEQLIEVALLLLARDRIAVRRSISASVRVPTRLGTMLQRVSRFQLYQARVVTRMGGAAPPCTYRQRALKASTTVAT